MSPAPPEWLLADAWVLEPPPADERAHVMRHEAGLLLDRLLVRVARGHGALDVALGEGLATLAHGDRTLRLGYSGIGDYARERLGIVARTARQWGPRLARELRSRPLLREAVRRGEVSARKAHAELTPHHGPGPAVQAPLPDSAEEPFVDVLRLDEDLRRLAATRTRWDELLGHLAMLLQWTGLWRDMQFASFGHYCAARLGMAERTVAQRAALERRLYALPKLRESLRAGRISYEKARLVASIADEASLGGGTRRA